MSQHYVITTSEKGGVFYAVITFLRGKVTIDSSRRSIGTTGVKASSESALWKVIAGAIKKRENGRVE